MESPVPQVIPVEQPKKSNTPLIIGIVVAVLLCCCCLVVLGVMLFMGSSVSNIYSSINQQLTALPEIPSMPSATSEPSNPTNPSSPTDNPSVPSVPSSLVPQGGLGDDLLRANTWPYVVTVATITGCKNPKPADTVITVLQQPDSKGVWKELWTITCDDGSTKPMNVLFTPNPNGKIDIKVNFTN